MAHSIDDKDWEIIEVIQVKGSVSNYSYTDKPSPGSNYYRLKQYDKDGVVAMLGERFIDFHINGATISVFPNPSRNLKS